MIELVRPTADLSDSWWRMVDAFGDEQIHGSNYRPGDRSVLGDPEAFEEWVDWLGRMEHPGTHVPDGFVPCSYRWIVEDNRVIGTIALRHELNALLLESAGHIGYAVEPGSRRRGVAGGALGHVLGMAAARGLDPVLLTCDVDNIASARTIESAGGVLEDERGGKRRYWIRTGASASPLSLAPVQTRAALLVPITRDEAAAMLEGRRPGEWAEGYPREDDLDAVRMMRRLDEWSPRHVVRRSDGMVVGSIGCYGPPDEHGVVEVGYGLVPQARGGGLMTDVLAAMCRALEAAGLTVRAHTAADNVASHRVLARVGFRREGVDEGEWRWRRPRPDVAVDRDSGTVSTT